MRQNPLTPEEHIAFLFSCGRDTSAIAERFKTIRKACGEFVLFKHQEELSPLYETEAHIEKILHASRAQKEMCHVA